MSNHSPGIAEEKIRHNYIALTTWLIADSAKRAIKKAKRYRIRPPLR